MVGLEPTFSVLPKARGLARYPTSLEPEAWGLKPVPSVRTAGFEPAIPWPPAKVRYQASLRSGREAAGVRLQAPKMEVGIGFHFKPWSLRSVV